MENEVKQCPSWCTHGVHGLHSVGCPNKYPAPSSPPVQEPPLLTFAEAMEALAAEKLVEVSHGGESPRWERMLFGSTWTTAEVARYAKYRYRLKPARALGRARELVAEAAAAYSNQPDSRAFREVVDIVERAVGEVLDRMDAKLLGPSECSRQLRAEFLGPSVPAQDQDR